MNIVNNIQLDKLDKTYRLVKLVKFTQGIHKIYIPYGKRELQKTKLFCLCLCLCINSKASKVIQAEVSGLWFTIFVLVKTQPIPVFGNFLHKVNYYVLRKESNYIHYSKPCQIHCNGLKEQ